MPSIRSEFLSGLQIEFSCGGRPGLMYNNVYLYDIEFRKAPCFNFDLKYIQSYLVRRSNEDADPNYVRSGHEIGFIVCTYIHRFISR